MPPLPMTFRTKDDDEKIIVEIDKNQLEKLMGALGWFSQDFLESIDRAEKDIEAGRVRKIDAFEELDD